MSFIARKSTEVSKAGKVAAVVADFRELGIRDTGFGDQEKVALVYVTEQLDSRKQPIVITQQVTRSLDERSHLYAAVSGILGGDDRVPDDGFDPAQLIGRQVTLEVDIVTTSSGDPFAKVIGVSPGADGQNVKIPAGFHRVMRIGRRA